MNQTVILRHRRENLQKCSLRGLEFREDLLFFSYPRERLPDLSNHLLLQVGAPPLSAKDQNRPLFLIDGTWRLTQIMTAQVAQGIETRSLPSHYRTAYPRRQSDCPNPHEGLASVEALYIAYLILGKKVDGLLDHYLWAEPFLVKNQLKNILPQR